MRYKTFHPSLFSVLRQQSSVQISDRNISPISSLVVRSPADSGCPSSYLLFMMNSISWCSHIMKCFLLWYCINLVHQWKNLWMVHKNLSMTFFQRHFLANCFCPYEIKFTFLKDFSFVKINSCSGHRVGQRRRTCSVKAVDGKRGLLVTMKNEELTRTTLCQPTPWPPKYEYICK